MLFYLEMLHAVSKDLHYLSIYLLSYWLLINQEAVKLRFIQITLNIILQIYPRVAHRLSNI